MNFFVLVFKIFFDQLENHFDRQKLFWLAQPLFCVAKTCALD